MSTPGAQRGPGRPRVDPDGETIKLTLRLGPSHVARLKAIAMVLGKDQAGAMRWLIENVLGSTAEELIESAGNVLPRNVLEAATKHVARGKPATRRKWER